MRYYIWDFTCNILEYLFLYKYLSNNTTTKNSHIMLIYAMIMNIFYPFLPTTFTFTILFIISEFIFTFLFFQNSLSKNIMLFIKYQLIKYTGYILLFIFHSIILWDFNAFIHLSYYLEYKDVICYSLIYTLYTLYINSKKINFYDPKYKYYFNTIIIVSLFTLSYVTLYICKNIAPDNFIIPLLFTAIYILIAIMISMYDHFIRILNENAQTKIALEKATMEADYAQNIDIKLKELLSIRHDIKNHLYTIDGMIKNNDLQKVHDYIHNIQNDFEDTYIIATPSGTISNILNYKYHICLNKRIRFEYEGNFSQIYVDDYRLITILGNLIDNAITATAKLDELSRLITVSINQIKSYLDITITNTHKEQLRTLGNEFLSTKENSTIEGLSMFHGIGLKNVRSTTELLNGELDIQYTNELFCVSVMIPNYSKKK